MSASGPASSRWRATAAVTASAILLGTAGTAAELGPDALSATTSATWRALLGGVLLVVVAVCRGEPPRFSGPGWRWVVLGSCSLFVNQLAFFEANARTGVALAALVTVATLPIAAGVIDWLWSGRRPSATWGIGVTVAILGAAVLTGGSADVAVSGVVLAVAAGVSGAGIGLSVQQAQSRSALVPALASVVGGGAVLLAPVALWRADEALASIGSGLTVAYLGVATLAGAYLLWAAGLRRLKLARVAVIGLLEPAVAAVLATAVLGERATMSLVVGAVTVVVGVAIASVPWRRPARLVGARARRPMSGQRSPW